MSTLRQQAALDLAAIFADEQAGPAWPVVVTDPNGNTATVRGINTDIGEELDPDTGVAVAGRQASVAFEITALTTAGLGLPVGIADKARKPWLVQWADSEGTVRRYKVMESKPDTMVGIVVCMLEVYFALDGIYTLAGAAVVEQDGDRVYRS